MRSAVFKAAAWLLLAACLAPPAMAQQFELKRVSTPQTRNALLPIANSFMIPTASGAATGLPRVSPAFVGPESQLPLRTAVVANWLFSWSAEEQKFEKAPRIQPARGQVPGVFGPCKIKTADGNLTEVECVVFPPQNNYCRVLTMPAGVMATSATIGGRRTFIGVCDTDYNGKFNDQARRPNSMHLGATINSDMLLIDLNGDGNFNTDLEKPGTPVEMMPLAPMVCIRDSYYKVTVAEDGSSLTLEQVELPMGTLMPGDPSAALAIASDAGVQTLVPAGTDGWKLPAGDYQPLHVILGKRDRQGTWTLTGNISGRREKMITVTADEQTKLAIGETLVVKANANVSSDRTLMMQYTITDEFGAYYGGGINLNGRQQPAPRFVILNEAGKQVRVGSFSYG